MHACALRNQLTTGDTTMTFFATKSRAIPKAMAIAALVLCGGAAQAATIGVVQPSTPIAQGSTFSVTIAIADLVGSGAPSLADFDIDIAFDASVLGYVGFAWGDPVLGDQLDLAHLGSLAIADESQSGAGFLNFFEVSYDDSAVLNAQQAGSFGLVTLTFQALIEGVSDLTIGVNALGDANGNPLGAQVQNASVHVSPVPVPPALPLFASALLLAGTARTRRNK